MAGKPVIFISSTSDLRVARDLVGKVLYSMGYEPIWQDVEPTTGGELLSILRRRVSAAEMMLQLVGDRYGAEPPAATAEFGRVSYTQFEARYAESLGRKVVYCFVAPGFATDPAPPEDDERRRLQAGYRRWLVDNNRLHYDDIASPVELELSIRRINSELESLRRTAQRRARRNMLMTIACAAGLAVLGGFAFAVLRASQHRQAVATTQAVEQGKQLKADTAAIRESIDAIMPRLLAEKSENDQLRSRLEAAARRLAEAHAAGDAGAGQKLAELRAGGDAKLLGRFLDEQIAKQERATMDLLNERAAVAFVTGDIVLVEQCARRVLALEPDDIHATNHLGWVYHLRGNFAAAEGQYKRVVELAAGDESVRATALGNLGALAFNRGDFDAAEKHYRTSLEINRKLGQLGGEAGGLCNLGGIAEARRDLDAAEKLYRESLEIERKLGRPAPQADALGHCGDIAAIRGDLDVAETLHRESLEINLRLGRLEGQANQLGALGEIAERRGNLDAAEKLYRESLGIERKLGRLAGEAVQLGRLGSIAKTRGNLAEARQLWTESRDLFARVGMPHRVKRMEGWLDELPPA